MIPAAWRTPALWLGRGLILLILFLSLVRTPALTSSFEGGDKLGHFLAYATLAGWYALLFRGRELLWRALAFVALGVLIEGLQGLTPHRQPDVWDVLANSLGVLAGACVGALLSALALRRRSLGLNAGEDCR